MVSKRVVHDTRTHPGFVAIEKDTVVGYVRYNIAEKDCEITVLESLHAVRGIGSVLINKVLHIAKESACLRVWLITTNANIHAIRFYQKFGSELRAMYINTIEEARKLKPQIPLTGMMVFH